MKPGKGWSIWKTFGALFGHRAGWRCALAAAMALSGCATGGGKLDRNLMAFQGQYLPSAGLAETYTVVCPDVLDLTFFHRPDLSGLHPIGVDGRLDLEPLGQPRVEGQTVHEIAQHLADLSDLPVSQVQVRVSQYRGQQVYLFGEVAGMPRAVPYLGQETVLDLLKRAGGITAGAAPGDVYVVRTHVGDAKRPEVFQVDLKAIVLNNDDRSNLRLQPFDQVHVGITRRAFLERCLPPWLRPCYERFCLCLPERK